MAARKLHFRNVVSWQSKIPYLFWRAGLLGRRIKRISLTTGEKVILRPPPATDAWTATEVFLLESYGPPKPITNVNRIVDLGANVGYSVLYFARCYPGAKIEAFEPHSAHIAQLKANLSANSLCDAVTVYPYAAGCSKQRLFLTDNETESKLVTEPVGRVLEVQVVDWFAFAAGQKIDLLKMDIEGGEYPILFDPRFEHLKVSHIVLEWHATSERPHADREIMDRLVSLGYHVYAGTEKTIPSCRFGVLWALRLGV